jgi:hypothetical protein
MDVSSKADYMPSSLAFDKALNDDMDKMEKLSMINANARYELINANQQLLDFQMNRYMRGKHNS